MRTYSFITSNINTLFSKKREKQTIMELKQSKHAKHLIIVKGEEKYHIVMGEFKVTEKTFDTPEQAEKYIGTKPYDILLNQTLIAQHYESKNKEENNKMVESEAKENV